MAHRVRAEEGDRGQGSLSVSGAVIGFGTVSVAQASHVCCGAHNPASVRIASSHPLALATDGCTRTHLGSGILAKGGLVMRGKVDRRAHQHQASVSASPDACQHGVIVQTRSMRQEFKESDRKSHSRLMFAFKSRTRLGHKHKDTDTFKRETGRAKHTRHKNRREGGKYSEWHESWFQSQAFRPGTTRHPTSSTSGRPTCRRAPRLSSLGRLWGLRSSTWPTTSNLLSLLASAHPQDQPELHHLAKAMDSLDMCVCVCLSVWLCVCVYLSVFVAVSVVLSASFDDLAMGG